MKFGPTIIKLRALHRVSQEQLASAAKVSRATIQNVEADRKAPQGDTVRGIAAAFGMTLEQLDAELAKDNAPTVTFDVPTNHDAWLESEATRLGVSIPDVLAALRRMAESDPDGLADAVANMQTDPSGLARIIGGKTLKGTTGSSPKKSSSPAARDRGQPSDRVPAGRKERRGCPVPSLLPDFQRD